jgi:pyruvyltransferase
LHDVGLVLHYNDELDIKMALERHSLKQERVINVEQDSISVIKEISEFRVIVSSSLHGFIAVDALGIPNVWIEPSDQVIEGGFKFQNYCSSVGRDKSSAFGCIYFT